MEHPCSSYLYRGLAVYWRESYFDRFLLFFGISLVYGQVTLLLSMKPFTSLKKWVWLPKNRGGPCRPWREARAPITSDVGPVNLYKQMIRATQIIKWAMETQRGIRCFGWKGIRWVNWISLIRDRSLYPAFKAFQLFFFSFPFCFSFSSYIYLLPFLFLFSFLVLESTHLCSFTFLIFQK